LHPLPRPDLEWTLLALLVVTSSSMPSRTGKLIGMPL